jgi:hypothetical protein
MLRGNRIRWYGRTPNYQALLNASTTVYSCGTNASVTEPANSGIQFIVVDKINTNINHWSSKQLPINEAGLNTIIRITRDG